MNATTDENDEQSTSTSTSSETTNEREEQIESTDGTYTADGILECRTDTEIPEGEPMGEMFPFAEYELEVGQTTATDEHTDEEYALWRVEGRPVGSTVEGITEVSPNLAEAVMGVCETLRRTHGGGV